MTDDICTTTQADIAADNYIAGIRKAKQLIVAAVMEFERPETGVEQPSAEIKDAVRFAFRALEMSLNVVIEQAEDSRDLMIEIEE